MATTARLGIDIVGTDKTRAAFMSTNRSLNAMQGSMSKLKVAFAGFAGGNLLASFARSMVNINKTSLPVKTALDNLGGAWTAFGLKVGEGGLNTALVSFANRMNAMLAGTDGLSSSIGKLMGGAVNTMSKVFEGIGRSIAFVYDNFAIFNRVAFAFIAIKIAQNIAFAGYNFLLFASAVRNTGLAMGLFNIMTSLGKKGILGLAAGGLILASAFDEVKVVIDAMIKKMEDGLGPAFGLVQKGMDALGFDTKALRMELAGGIIGQGLPGAKLDQATNSIKKFSGGVQELTATGSAASKAFQEIGQTFSSAFGSAFNSIIDRTMSVKEAFASMATSILKDLTSLFANKAFSQLFGGGDSGGGLLGKVFESFFKSSATPAPSASFGGPRASGGPVSAGRSYLVGERGPEFFSPGSSGSVIPNRATSAVNMKVNIYNQTGADVQTKPSVNGRELDVFLTNKVRSVIGSGVADSEMRNRFGATPQKTRR